ncbi:MAG TPA: ATP-binding protein [Myxococcota bacterium]|nr:ATP-binding protein [Myxococcota bacterium]
MTSDSGSSPSGPATAEPARPRVAQLELELAQARRVIETLMDRVEKSSRSYDGADLFARNMELQRVVSSHTAALKEANARLEAEARERAQAERERQELQARLTEQDRMVSIGTLAAGLAHEINTPIQFIGDNTFFLGEALDHILGQLAATEELLYEIASPADPRVARLRRLAEDCELPFLRAQAPIGITRLTEGVERVTHIVKAMRSFTHQGPGTLIESNLNDAVHNALILLASPLRFLAEVEVALGPVPPLVCDIGALHQVFLNLVQNAAHAIEDAGRGRGEGRLRVGSFVDGDRAVVEVSDNGCGMSPEVRARAFDPFFTTKAVGRGTGQGMTISRNIVHRHGGRILVVDREGWATTVRVELPLGVGARPLHGERNGDDKPIGED